jgi:hypothetical protein
MIRRLTALVAGLLLALLAPPAAPAKEGVRATLIGAVAVDARPGERITMAWKLEDARGRPFGASGLFVRLRSAVGGRAVTAITDGSGRFAVRMTVPEGGIGAIEFGLRGGGSSPDGDRGRTCSSHSRTTRLPARRFGPLGGPPARRPTRTTSYHPGSSS